MVIATDLDGTLLSDSTSVSRENLDAIKRLYEAGCLLYTSPSPRD